MTVEVAARPVVMLSGAWVGMAGQDLRIAQRDACVQGIRDRRVTQRMWADVSWDLCDLRDPDNHPVGIPSVDRFARVRTENQRPGRSFAAACLEHSKHGDGDGHSRRLVAFADQMEHPMSAKSFAVVLDSHGRSFRCAKGFARSTGQGTRPQPTALRTCWSVGTEITSLKLP